MYDDATNKMDFLDNILPRHPFTRDHHPEFPTLLWEWAYAHMINQLSLPDLIHPHPEAQTAITYEGLRRKTLVLDQGQQKRKRESESAEPGSRKFCRV